MLTLKMWEIVGKNTSKCRRWFTKVDAYWKIVKTCQKGETHTLCTIKSDKLETQGQLEFEHKFETTETGLYNLLVWSV